MKKMLISAVSAIIMFGMAYASEVIVSPVVQRHEASIAQLSVSRDGVVLCTTKYITNTSGDGSRTIRRSVDCDE